MPFHIFLLQFFLLFVHVDFVSYSNLISVQITCDIVFVQWKVSIFLVMIFIRYCDDLFKQEGRGGRFILKFSKMFPTTLIYISGERIKNIPSHDEISSLCLFKNRNNFHLQILSYKICAVFPGYFLDYSYTQLVHIAMMVFCVRLVGKIDNSWN